GNAKTIREGAHAECVRVNDTEEAENTERMRNSVNSLAGGGRRMPGGGASWLKSVRIQRAVARSKKADPSADTAASTASRREARPSSVASAITPPVSDAPTSATAVRVARPFGTRALPTARTRRR